MTSENPGVLYPLITEVSEIFKKTGKPFWLAGGYSLDLFLGRITRAHEHLDFVVKREDQLWQKGHFYELPVHNIWCRKNETSAWDLEILFSEFEGDEWVYRRNNSIRGPMSSFSWITGGGLVVLAPEIQLLYKSRSKRPKDFQDLHNCLPKLTAQKKKTLKEWIKLDSGIDHPWVPLIKDES